MSPSATGQPVYLKGASEPLFGFFHAPPASSPTRVPVLICAPFAWDDISSYRPRREWATQLASRGHATLRFDWPGTGDSGGSPRDPERLEAWTEAVDTAARWLILTVGCRRVAAIGLGLGGLVALRAAARGTPLDELVLWAVPARGRKFVRELEMFGRLQAAGNPSGGAATGALAEGAVQAGGFLFTADTCAAIEALDVEAMPLPAAAPRRALLLDRDGIAVEPGLREMLERGSVEVTEERGPGYGAMTEGPQEARAPLEVFDRVASWLGEASSADYQPPIVPYPEQAIELEVDGASIREMPFSVDQAFGRLFGVLSVPAGPPADVCAVLLNAGAIRRIGPNRMWVEMARRAAARGVPTLRLDLEGLGDADGDAARYAQVAELYVPRLIDQARAALDAMTTRGFSPHFVLGGLCSGAYWSFHAALHDDRVLAAFLVNPQVLFWDSSVVIARDARRVRRELLQGVSWRRLLRGEMPIRRVLEITRAASGWIRLTVGRVVGPFRGRGTSQHFQSEPIEDALAVLRDAQKRVMLVFGGEEPLRDELEQEGRLGALESYPNLELELVPGAPHTLSPVWAQRRVHGLFDRFLARELDAPRS